MRSRRSAFFALLSVFAVLAAACGGDDTEDSVPATNTQTDTTPVSDEWAAVLDAAASEGRVTVYSVLVPDINERLEAAFESQYPDIDLEIVRVLTDTDAKLQAEETTGADGADALIHLNYVWIENAVAEGKLIEPVGPNTQLDEWSAERLDLGGGARVTTFTNIGVGWNTTQFDGTIDSYEDLLDEDLAGGKIGLAVPASLAIPDFYAHLEDTFGTEFLEALADQDPTLFDTAVPLEQALAAGEIAVGGYVTNVGITALQDQGAPVEYALPEEAWAPSIITYIPAWAARPNAAQVFYDFVSSAQGQAVLGEGSFSPIEETPGTFAPLDGVTLLDIDRVSTDGWAPDYIEHWNSIFRS